MRKTMLYAAFGFFALTAGLPSGHAAVAPGHPGEPAMPVIAVQYYGPGPYYQGGGPWQRCRWLRRRAQEVEYRLGGAPPWDRPRLHQRLASLRQELWETCRW